MTIVDEQTRDEIALAMCEQRMRDLCAKRNETIARAKRMIADANQTYDQAAIPLGRQIKGLQDRLEAMREAAEPVKVTRQRQSETHDPDWTQEDIDHFYELKRRGNKARV